MSSWEVMTNFPFLMKTNLSLLFMHIQWDLGNVLSLSPILSPSLSPRFLSTSRRNSRTNIPQVTSHFERLCLKNRIVNHSITECSLSTCYCQMLYAEPNVECHLILLWVLQHEWQKPRLREARKSPKGLGFSMKKPRMNLHLSDSKMGQKTTSWLPQINVKSINKYMCMYVYISIWSALKKTTLEYISSLLIIYGIMYESVHMYNFNFPEHLLLW